MEYRKIKEALYLYNDTDSIKIDEELLNELAELIEVIGVGRGDCFRVYCEKYCPTVKSCSDAIKKSIIEIIEKDD